MHPEREKLLSFYGNDLPGVFENGLLSKIVPSNEWVDQYGVWDGRKIFDWSTQVLESIERVTFGKDEVDLQCMEFGPREGRNDKPIRLLIGHAEQMYRNSGGKNGYSPKTWIFRRGVMVGYYKPKYLKRLSVDNMRVSEKGTLEVDQALGDAYVQVFHPITDRTVWAPHWYDNMERWFNSNHGVPVMLAYAMRVINYRLSWIFESSDLDNNEEYQRLLHEAGVSCDYGLVADQESDEYGSQHRAKFFWGRVVNPSSEPTGNYRDVKCPITRVVWRALAHPYWSKRGLNNITPKAVYDFYQRVRELPDDPEFYGSIENRAAMYAELIKDFRSLMVGVELSENY